MRTAFIAIISLFCASRTFAEEIRATTSLPGNLFLEGQPCEFSGVAEGATWSVSDWQQRVTASGTQAATGPLSPASPPAGYYKLTVQQSGKTFAVPFGVLVDPAKRVADPDSPYAVDSAQSRFAQTTPGRDPAAAAQLARLAGVPQVRDRLSWKDTNTESGRFTWGKYGGSADVLREKKIQVLSPFSSAPPWTRSHLKDLPDDLLALYDFTKAAGKRFDGSISAWEFWNEPDLDYCRDPAWDFASAQKAAYLGFKAGAPAASVLLGSNAVHPTTRFFEVALENGAGGSCDRYNVHLYGSDTTFPGIIAEKKRVLERFGLASLPIWVTEVGTAAGEAGGAPPSVAGDNREHSEAQEMTQAEHLVKSLVRLPAAGVQRSFYFMLLPYNERGGQKPWGLLRWNWTVKPAYCALANLTSRLAGHDFIDTIELEGVEAFLFGRRGEPTQPQTVVFWAANQPLAAKASWARDAKLFDVMGTTKPLAADPAGEPMLFATSMPQFLTNVTPLPRKPTSAPASPPEHKAQPVVLSFAMDDSSIVVSRSALNLPDAGAGVPASLKVWNLSDEAHTVTLTNASAGVTIGALPESLTLAPREMRAIPLNLQRAENPVPKPAITIKGESENVPVAPLVVPARPSLAAFKRSPVNISRPDVWLAKSSGKLSLTPNADEKEMRFSVKYAAIPDRWVYPALQLASAGVDLGSTAGLSFEIRAEGETAGVKRSNVMIKTKNSSGNARIFTFPYWLTTKWQTVTLLWDFDAPADFKPASAVEVQVGANPNRDQLTYGVRGMETLSRP